MFFYKSYGRIFNNYYLYLHCEQNEDLHCSPRDSVGGLNKPDLLEAAGRDGRAGGEGRAGNSSQGSSQSTPRRGGPTQTQQHSHAG